jgi:NAD+ synthase
MKNLRVALVQCNPTVGDIAGNADKIIETAQKLEGQADLIAFPELALSGYSPEDMVQVPSFRHSIMVEADRILRETRDLELDIILPLPEADGAITVYNSAAHIGQGAIKGTIRKHHLPNYRVFDEKRVFTAGPLNQPCLSVQGFKIGLVICEDTWFADVAANRVSQGADFILSVNASPIEDDKFARRISIAERRVHELNCPLLYLNCIGGQDEVVFDGASFAIDTDGKMKASAKAFDEEILVINLERTENGARLQDGVTNRYPDRLETLYRGAIMGLRDYVDKNDFPGVLLGLSGGIDSALTAVMAVDALGPARVRAVMMPSPFTAQDSLDDAAMIAKNLGLEYQIMPIAPLMQTFESTIPNLSGLAHENMQSRARGTILMSLSNQSGYMVVTTGNKSENAVGYATLYGDMCGGYNAIKDLYKVDVYALSRWRNANGAPIPERVITRAPSAELKPNQTDQDSLPPYEMLDTILRGLIELNRSPDDLVQSGMDRATVERVVGLLRRSEYKRRQAAPGAKLGSRAFGRDWRMPITNKFRG